MAGFAIGWVEPRETGNDDLQKATGKALRTLYNDVQRGLLPKPEARGAWLAEEPEIYRKLCAYIEGTAGPGQGARTDLRK